MNNWEKHNEILLSNKKYFHSLLNMENITAAAYTHGKRICKDFIIKHLP